MCECTLLTHYQSHQTIIYRLTVRCNHHRLNCQIRRCNAIGSILNYQIRDCISFTPNRIGRWGLPFLNIYDSIQIPNHMSLLSPSTLSDVREARWKSLVYTGSRCTGCPKKAVRAFQERLGDIFQNCFCILKSVVCISTSSKKENQHSKSYSTKVTGLGIYEKLLGKYHRVFPKNSFFLGHTVCYS